MKTKQKAAQTETVTKRIPTLYRISSAMAHLQVSRTSIYRLVARGDLELVKVGARTSRITSDSLLRVMSGKAPKERQPDNLNVVPIEAVTAPDQL